MRVIAGTHRGRRITAPKGDDTRPTSDRVRENAFNLIGPVDDAEGSGCGESFPPADFANRNIVTFGCG